MGKIIFNAMQIMLIILGLRVFAFADNPATIVGKGNNFYKQKKYDEALTLYNQAQIKNPDSARINYDIGAAQFKKGDYDAAISSFEKATAAKDNILESKANYNIANSKYRLGKLKENTDLSKAVKLSRESLDYYQRAIELNPRDEDAKANHELVERELKVLLDKLKQQQDKQKQQGQQQKEGEGKQQQQGQGQSQRTEEKQGEEKKEENKPQEGSEQEKQNQENQGKEGQAKEQESQGQGAQDKEKQVKEAGQKEGQESAQGKEEAAREMSQQEANMLLEGYRGEENNFGKLDDQRRGRVGEAEKDW